MRLKVLLLTMLFSGTVLYAQTDFRPGYVIELSGDTLWGEIDYRGELMMGDSCRIRISKEDIRTFYPYQITGYRFTDGKYYVARQINGRYVFLEYLINGKISIYYVREKDGDKYYIEKEGEDITELPYEKGTKLVDKSIYDNINDQSTEVFYESTQHIGLLKYYMQDYPDIMGKVENTKRLNHNDLIDLAEEYHNGVCFDESCIIYEKNKPKVSFSVEPFIGQVLLTSTSGFDLVNTQEIGGNIYISLPRASEKIYFKTGQIYSVTSFAGKEAETYNKTPLQFQYMFTAHKLIPKAGIGVNFWRTKDYGGHKEYFYTWDFNVGVNYSITKFMDLSLGFNT